MNLQSFLLSSLLSSFLFGGNSGLFDWNDGWSVDSLFAVGFNAFEGSVGDELLQQHAGDGADDFVLFDDAGD